MKSFDDYKEDFFTSLSNASIESALIKMSDSPQYVTAINRALANNNEKEIGSIVMSFIKIDLDDDAQDYARLQIFERSNNRRVSSHE